MSKVKEFHKMGYNCCESVIKAANEEKGLNIPVSVGTPFGGGMSCGSTCGAIVGAIMAVGAARGRESSKEPNEARKYAQEIMKAVKEKYGTFDCIELKKNKISCDEIIEYAYGLVNKEI